MTQFLTRPVLIWGVLIGSVAHLDSALKLGLVDSILGPTAKIWVVGAVGALGVWFAARELT